MTDVCAVAVHVTTTKAMQAYALFACMSKEVRNVKHLQWAVVCLLFWISTVTFRLAYASDVTDWLVWWISLGVAFGFPVAIGYNLACWRFYTKSHHVRFDDDEDEKAKDITE